MKEAMELYPDDAQVYNFLGYTYADHNVRLEEALKLIEKAHQMAPEDGNIVDSLGWVYYRLGKYELAIQHLKRRWIWKPIIRLFWNIWAMPARKLVI